MGDEQNNPTNSQKDDLKQSGEQFYELKAKLTIAEANLTRLEKSVADLEKLKMIFMVSLAVFAVFGLSGGVIASYSLNKLYTVEKRMNSIDEATAKSLKDIDTHCVEAESNIDQYARGQLPMLSKETLDYIHKFGVADVKFTDDCQNWQHSENKFGGMSVLIDERSIPAEHDNYLTLVRPQ